ncbi:MAG: hypothetical protein ACOC0P_01590, partial [Planctomycetota bacterium]
MHAGAREPMLAGDGVVATADQGSIGVNKAGTGSPQEGASSGSLEERTVVPPDLPMPPWLVEALEEQAEEGKTADAASSELAKSPAFVWVDPAIIAITMLLTLVGLGWCSRKFERQADAFAAQHLSGGGIRGTENVPISIEAVTAMVSALQLVAELNHIPVKRRSWRHGSIASRQRYLYSLVKKPCRQVSIDRTVVRLKFSILLALAATIILNMFLMR